MTSIFPAATLDRTYARWEEHLYELTPVEQGASGMLYKREDAFAPLGYGGINGSKLRQLIYLIHEYVCTEATQNEDAGILTGASVLSPQVSMSALVGRHYGLPVAVVLGATKPETALRHENVAIAEQAGARFLFHPVGYNPALQKAVADLHATPEFRDWYRLCYGITTPGETPAEVEAFHRVGAFQTRNIPDTVRTLVMTAGSCNSCVSVLYGIAKEPPPNLERIVLLGVGPTRLQWIEDRLEMIEEAVERIHRIDCDADCDCDCFPRSLYRRRYHHHSALEAEHQTDGRILLEHYDLHATKFATYQDRMPFSIDGIEMHPTYEGKALAYMNSRAEFDWYWDAAGDVLFWIVGSAPSRRAMLDAFLLDGVHGA